ncbi:MAG: Gfo/Idh/MocA family oxidoreductase [Spirochaetia bacterium]
MRKEWFLEMGPWEVVEKKLAKGTVGQAVEVCVQEIRQEMQAAQGPRERVQTWVDRLSRMFGQVDSQSLLEKKFFVSGLLRFSSGLLARIFIDFAAFGMTDSLDFEIIGTKSSLIYRSNKGLGCYSIETSKGKFLGRTMCSDGVASDLREFTPIKSGIIRLGVISLEHPHATGNHFPALDNIQHVVKVAAIAHDNKKECEEWLHRYGATYYKSRDELLQDKSIDAVLVTSRNCDHARDSVAAAKARKDILCDKPIAISLEENLALVRACRDNHVRFITTYPLRFHPAITEIQNRIKQGDFGDIEAIMATNHGCMYEPGAPEWVKDPLTNGGGCIIDHTVHVADIIRFLTGKEFINVRTYAKSALSGIKAEDIAVCHGELDGGAVYQIDCSWSRKPSDPPWGDVTMRIIGTKGCASLDLYNNYRIEAFTPSGIEYRYPNALSKQHGMIFLDYQKEKATGEKSTNADETDGLRTMELVFASYESVKADTVASVRRSQI